MSDIKQFTAELLEGKSITIGVVGTVLHAFLLYPGGPDIPAVWMVQHETDGAIYTAVCITREPELANGIKEGDQLVFHSIPPENEGSPVFLYASKYKEPTEQDAFPQERMIENVLEDEPDPPAFNAAARDEKVETPIVA